MARRETEKEAAGAWALVKRSDWLWLLGILLLAGLAWLALGGWFGGGGQAAVAHVTVGYGEDQYQMQISLDSTRTVTIDDALLPVRLEVEPGRIRFVDSVCPDHICENTGWLERDGQTAVCMPAGVAVRLEAPPESGE